MPGQSDSPASAMSASSSRPLGLCMRRDLEFRRQNYQGRDYWVVKDPISLKYYRFEEEEFTLLNLLDGKSSPDQIKRRFDFEFAPQKISLPELFQFVGMLHRSSLLVSELPHQGIELLKRARESKAQQRRQSLTNILAIRYRGFDPDWLLTHLLKYTGWFFSWPAFTCVLMIGLSAIALLITQFESFQTKLPSFHEFFAASNWIWLALVMALTKGLHEFGHGLACKKFGGQCHEMGVMLLVLTPCLYANVSDSWLLPCKWKRAFIAAAGMYVELVLSALAVFVWWFSEPGLLNQLALNLVFVSSVSTLLFNANPLLRYDGYYILADLIEIPNLRSKATTVLQRFCGQWLLGIDARPDPFLPVRHQWLFASYSLAAAAYRWFITFSIFWFVYNLLEPYGFKIIGQLIALSAIYGLLGMPLIQLYKFFSVPGRFGTVKPVRAGLSAVVLTAIMLAILIVPLPNHIYCSCYIQPQDASSVYVDVPGQLETIYSHPNQTVRAGQPIIILKSRKLKTQLASLQTELDLANVHRNNLLRAQHADESAAQKIEEAQVALQSAAANLSKRRRDAERLVVRAPVGGLLLAPPRIPQPPDNAGELPSWSGTPLDPENAGASLDEQTLVGKVVPDPTRMQAVLVIDQQDIEFVHPDQPVRLLIHQLPGRVFESSTSLISPSKMELVPKALSSKYGGDVVSRTDAEGRDIPQSTKYLVTVAIDNQEELIVDGSTGIAKIRSGSRTVAQRIWRLLARTFQFDL